MAKKKFFDENGNEVKAKEKKPFYKKWWFWLIIVIVIGGAAIGGGGDEAAENESDSGKTEETADKKEEATEEEPTEEETASLVDQYNDIQIGEGGATPDDVKSVFGEPDSTSESTIADVNTVMNMWSALEGGDLFSGLTVSFSDGVAMSKSVTGLPVDESEKVTKEKYDAIPTDGSYTLEQAEEDLGQPNGYSETDIMGMRTNMVSWSSNTEGDLGANFNVTFQDGVATSKAQGGLE